MTKKEFIKLEQNRKARNNITVSAVLCFISCVITFAAMALTDLLGPEAILDVLILLVLGLLLIIRKSFPAAVALTVYGAINTVVTSIMLGRPSGWLTLLAGIFAVVYTRKINAEWKKYQEGGQYAAAAGPAGNNEQTVYINEVRPVEPAAPDVRPFEPVAPAEPDVVEFSPADEYDPLDNEPTIIENRD